MSDGRFVWISREQRDVIDYLAATDVLESIVAAWDAAPADAEAAIANALLLLPKTPEARSVVAIAVLRALGMPEASS